MSKKIKKALEVKAQKPKWHLFAPLWTPLEMVVRVLENGEKKYSRENWKTMTDDNGGPPIEFYSNAMQRHLKEHWEGKLFDKDSGLPVLAHAICDAFFVLWFQLQPAGKPKP